MGKVFQINLDPDDGVRKMLKMWSNLGKGDAVADDSGGGVVVVSAETRALLVAMLGQLLLLVLLLCLLSVFVAPVETLYCDHSGDQGQHDHPTYQKGDGSLQVPHHHPAAQVGPGFDVLRQTQRTPHGPYKTH